MTEDLHAGIAHVRSAIDSKTPLDPDALPRSFEIGDYILGQLRAGCLTPKQVAPVVSWTYVTPSIPPGRLILLRNGGAIRVPEGTLEAPLGPLVSCRPAATVPPAAPRDIYCEVSAFDAFRHRDWQARVLGMSEAFGPEQIDLEEFTWRWQLLTIGFGVPDWEVVVSSWLGRPHGAHLGRLLRQALRAGRGDDNLKVIRRMANTCEAYLSAAMAPLETATPQTHTADCTVRAVLAVLDDFNTPVGLSPNDVAYFMAHGDAFRSGNLEENKQRLLHDYNARALKKALGL